MNASNSNTPVSVSISGTMPPYNVTLSPAGPYRITSPGSTLTMSLDSASSAAGFKLYGIGFREPESEAQLTARLSTAQNPDDTLTIVDAKSEDGQFEFVLLYQDRNGGATVYGLDPEIDNEEP